MEQLARHESGDAMAQRLKARLWFERGLFLALVAAGLTGYALFLHAQRGACVVEVEGQPAVVMESQGAADHVLGEIKRSAGRVPQAGFAQQVTFHRVSSKGAPVVSEAEALKTLSSQLTVVVPGVGVFVDGKLLFGFADRSQAVGAVSALLVELSPPGPGLTRTFAGKLKIASAQIPVRSFLPSAGAAVSSVREALAARKYHVVRPGDSLWQIAQDCHVTTDRVRRANPEVDFARLKAGDTVAIPVGASPVTVVAWKEIPEQADGGATVVRVKYVNGEETERQVISRLRRPQEERATRPKSVRPRKPRAEASVRRARRAQEKAAPPPEGPGLEPEVAPAPSSNENPPAQETPGEP